MNYPCLFCPSDNFEHPLALLTRWCASARTLFYSFHTLLDHSTNIIRKMRAPRRVSVSGAPNDVQNCHLDKTNMDNSSMHQSDICLVLNFFSFMNKYPRALVSPHTILYFVSQFAETHALQSGKHWPAGLQQTGQNSALYRRMPRKILGLASKKGSWKSISSK